MKESVKQLNEINHGCELKRPYSRMMITPVKVEMGSAILAESVVNDSTIMTTGQEIGPSFDFSSDFDSNTGKTFSHEWEGSL